MITYVISTIIDVDLLYWSCIPLNIPQLIMKIKRNSEITTEILDALMQEWRKTLQGGELGGWLLKEIYYRHGPLSEFILGLEKGKFAKELADEFDMEYVPCITMDRN